MAHTRVVLLVVVLLMATPVKATLGDRTVTLPHGMVRVLLAEQLYRAWSITQNHPYHRV